MVTTLKDIAQHCGATLEGDGSREVIGPADLGGADGQEVSFLANPRYAPLLETTRAAGVLVARDVTCEREDVALLRVDDPNRAFTEVIRLFAVTEANAEAGVHPSSFIDSGAEVDPTASIGPLCAVGAGSRIAAGVVLRSGVQVGVGVQIGPETIVHAAAVLGDRVRVGARCVINSGAVIGSDGFGFEPTAEGWAKIPQCGTVHIGDDVEIGANATIDRARFGATKIGDMVKIDNLVQVAHNLVIGDASLICAQVGLAGSAKLGKRVIVGGQAGIGGHMNVGDGAQVGGQSGVLADLEPGASAAGWPARPLKEVLKGVANTRRIPRLQKAIKDLEVRLKRLEQEDE